MEILPHINLPDPQQLLDKLLIAIIVWGLKTVKDWVLTDNPKQEKSKKPKRSKRRKRK